MEGKRWNGGEGIHVVMYKTKYKDQDTEYISHGTSLVVLLGAQTSAT